MADELHSDETLNPGKALAQILRGWRQAGVDFLPPGRPKPPAVEDTASAQAASPLAAPTLAPPPVPAAPPRPLAPQEAPPEMPRPRPAPVALFEDDNSPIWPDPKPKPAEERLALLEPIRLEVSKCTRCPELVANRTQTVFGVGNVRPRLCFFGEAPGADEDKQGEPFVGRAGQLLDKIIEAMTLKREEVYILNTLKCRPPNNRTPLPDEVENCRCYFTRQLEILRPEFLVCLGACAAQALLRTKESIGRLRGRAHDYRGIKVYATYHPAYLLRNPPAKRDVWEDMKVVMKAMGLAIPKS